MAILILLFVAFFYNFFFLGQTLFIGDNLLALVPHKIFVWENLKKGILPLWNPYVWGGYPEVADVTFGLFNPFSLIHFVFPNLQSTTLIFLLTSFIALCGTYVFSNKILGISKWGSVLASIIFAFCGSMMNISADVIRNESVCFLPWICYFLAKRKFFPLTFLMVINLLIGQTQHFYIIILFCLIYSFYLVAFQQKEKTFAIFCFSLFFTIGLSSFFLLPQIELLNYSSRHQASFEYNTIWSLNPLSLIRFFFAHFWGVHNEGSFWGPDVTYQFGYVGFFPLVLVLSNLKKLNKRTAFFAIIAVISLFMAFGKYTFFYRIFLLIPGFSLFRNPSSWLILYSFCLAVETAQLAEQSLATKKKLFCFLGILIELAGCFLLICSKNSLLPNSIFALLASLVHKNLSSFHTLTVDQQIFFFIGRNFAVVGFLALVLSQKLNLKTLVAVVFMDLMFFAKSDLMAVHLPSDPFHELKKSSPVLFLKKNLGDYRFVSTSEFSPNRGISIYMCDLSRRPPFINRNFWIWPENELTNFQAYYRQLKLLPPNISTAFELPSLNGYSGFYLQTFADFFASPSSKLSSSAKLIREIQSKNTPQFDPSRVNFNFISFEDLRISDFAVKYVLADEKLQLSHFKEIPLDNGFFIYENMNVKPRVQIRRNGDWLTTSYHLKTTNPNKLSIDLADQEIKNGDELIIRDIYYPGWESKDQNQKKLKVESEGIFRKIILNKETKIVSLEFRPKSFFIGLKISAIFLLALIFILGFKAKYILKLTCQKK